MNPPLGASPYLPAVWMPHVRLQMSTNKGVCVCVCRWCIRSTKITSLWQAVSRTLHRYHQANLEGDRNDYHVPCATTALARAKQLSLGSSPTLAVAWDCGTSGTSRRESSANASRFAWLSISARSFCDISSLRPPRSRRQTTSLQRSCQHCQPARIPKLPEVPQPSATRNPLPPPVWAMSRSKLSCFARDITSDATHDLRLCDERCKRSRAPPPSTDDRTHSSKAICEGNYLFEPSSSAAYAAT